MTTRPRPAMDDRGEAARGRPIAAYLVTRYPAASKAFLQREVIALRRRGLDVRTVSIRRALAHELLSAADRSDQEDTHVLVPPRPSQLVLAHVIALVRRPRRYLRTLGFALTLHAPGLRRLWQLFYFGEAILLWRWCHREGVRHVHAHFAPSQDVALLLVHFADDPRPYGERWSWSFAMHGTADFSNMKLQRVDEKVRHAAWVACVSDYGRGLLMSVSRPQDWEKIVVIRCGVDLTAYVPAPRADANGAARLLTVGRLVAEKGHLILLRTVAALSARGVLTELTIVGDGPQRSALERSARSLGVAERVEFLGAVGQHELPARYAAADVFCLPSLSEGLPVVLMEAMAMEVPVVATRIAGVPELVEDGVCGRLVTPGAVDELVDVLGELIPDPTLRRRLGEAGRRKVAEDFDVDSSAARLAALLQRGRG